MSPITREQSHAAIDWVLQRKRDAIDEQAARDYCGAVAALTSSPAPSTVAGEAGDARGRREAALVRQPDDLSYHPSYADLFAAVVEVGLSIELHPIDGEWQAVVTGGRMPEITAMGRTPAAALDWAIDQSLGQIAADASSLRSGQESGR